MNHRISLLIFCLSLAACREEPQSVSNTSNPGFQVGLLFEHDGCRVYRFVDGGNHQYYVRCGDGEVSTRSEHTESCGKNCTTTKTETIPTVEQR